MTVGLDARIVYELRKGMPGRSASDIKALMERFKENCGGEASGIVSIFLPSDELNRLNTSGSHVTAFYIAEIDPDASDAEVPIKWHKLHGRTPKKARKRTGVAGHEHIHQDSLASSADKESRNGGRRGGGANVPAN